MAGETEDESTIPPPSNPIAIKINMAILGFYFDWFVRKYLPAFKTEITSSYRDASKNSAVGGASNSAHLHGLAYDFVLQNQDGSAMDKARAKSIFQNYIAPNWNGFALWEETPAGVWHVHVNLSRKVSTYAGIMGVAAIGTIGFAIIKSISEGSKS